MVLTVVLVLSERNSTYGSAENEFAVTDTASITKIFLANMDGSSVLLEKKDSGSWILNSEYPVQKTVIETLLRTMMYVTVRMPVATSARDNVLKFIASGGTKVEIYQEVYLIDFLGIKLFKRERRTKTYYVGDNTQDNSGTYMKMEKSDVPFVTYIPGFSGFLHTRYSTNQYDWRDHTVVSLYLKDIDKISMNYPQVPEKSFILENPDNKNFKLFAIASKQYVSNADTMKMINYLSGFYDVRFEFFEQDAEHNLRDSLLAIEPFQELTIFPRKGNPITLTTYLKPNSLSAEDVEARYFDDSDYKWDRERMWAFVNNGKDLVTIQYFVFGRILKPLQYFLEGTEEGVSQTFVIEEMH